MHTKRLINSKQGKRNFFEKLKRLIKNKTNHEVESAVKRFVFGIPQTNLVDCDGETLVHAAVKCNNFQLINFLVDLGYSANVKNSSGVTPLIAALSSDNFGAIEALLTANVKVHTEDCESVLQIAIEKKNILPVSTSRALMHMLKRCSVDLRAMAGLLLKVNCPLMFVVYMRSAQLTQMMLDMPDYRFGDYEYQVVIEYVIEKTDLENLRVLLQHEQMTQLKRTAQFLISSSIICSTMNWEHMKPLFNRLSEWIVLDDNTIRFLQVIFESGGKDEVQILLKQCNVDVQMKEQYNFDVLPMLFGNREFNTEDLLKVMHERQFNINAKSCKGLSAMHFAGIIDSQSNLQLLLESNADCNLTDVHGLTPLWYFQTVECVELLLQSGADLHIASNNDSTVMDTMRESKATWKVMLAQLAVDHHKGVKIRETTLERINQNPTFKVHYESFLEQVEQLKMCDVLSGFTLFDIITTKAKNIARYVDDLETVTSILDWCSKRSLDPYYVSSLKMNLDKAHNIYRSKCQAASIISQGILVRIHFDDLIIDRIFDFLSYHDVITLASV